MLKTFCSKSGECKQFSQLSCSPLYPTANSLENPRPLYSVISLRLPLCSVIHFQARFLSQISSLDLHSVTYSKWHAPFFATYPPQYPDEASPFSSWFSQPLINIPCSLPVSARANEQEVGGRSVRGKGGTKDRLCQCFLHTEAIVF